VATPRSSIRAVLFDLDRTLLDFDRAQRAALRVTLVAQGLPYSPRVLSGFRAINDTLWAAYRRGEIAQAELEVERFRRLLSILGARTGPSRRLARAFRGHLSGRGDRLPGCRAALFGLKKRFRLGVVTNGIDRVQHARLAASGLRPFFETVITSEGCGYAKPDPRIVQAALRELAVSARETVYVGDDLAVDGGAARAAGTGFVWVDRGDPRPRGHVAPRLRVTHLAQLERRFRPL
jgi:YjjG family noncanonical pyrimidine nucleotidase